MSFGKRGASLGPRDWSVQELGAFYRDHRREFLAFAIGILKDKSRSEEVVQDAFIKVLLAAPELESREHALSYMRRTIKNLCIDVFRIEGRRPYLVALDADSLDVDSLWVESEDIGEEMTVAEDAFIVRQALSLLSPAERSALVMWDMEGRSTKEIAKELGVKESTVRHTVSRARTSLRRVLTEIIVDERRGLTAVDLLSSTYLRASRFTKKSGRAVLSLSLVLVSILGLNSLLTNFGFPSATTEEDSSISIVSSPGDFSSSQRSVSLASSANLKAKPIFPVSSNTNPTNLKSKIFDFAGIDSRGIPLGFTVTDSTHGELGSLYTSTRGLKSSPESQFDLYQIVKTDTGAANIFMSQRILTDSGDLRFTPVVSYGKDGYWVPLVTSVTLLDSKRLRGGDYVVSAVIEVESEVETSIQVPATAGGRDLLLAPRQIITRLVLNEERTQVLAQAVRIIEGE